MLRAILFLSISLISLNGHAGIKKSSSKVIKKPFYLGKAESRQLQKELTKNKMNAETFTLTFKCDKYKRDPSAKKRSLNCLAVSVTPEIVVKSNK
jgi:hypothetical protein